MDEMKFWIEVYIYISSFHIEILVDNTSEFRKLRSHKQDLIKTDTTSFSKTCHHMSHSVFCVRDCDELIGSR